ncbi:MAG: protein YgfX [Gallionella sp.]
MLSAITLQLSVKPSLRFAGWLLLLHIITATVVYATAMPLPVRLAMLLMIFLSLFYYLMRDVLLVFPDSWHEISLDPDGVSVIVRDGSSFIGQVADNTSVSPYFIVLCVKVEGHRPRVSRVIFPDAMGETAFRELSVRLKFA